MRFYTFITAFIFVAVMCGCARQGENVSGDYFYKIENRGVQAGYGVIDTQLVVRDDEDLMRLDWRIHYESKLMGSNMDTEIRTTYLMEPDTRRVRHVEGESSTGQRNIRWEFEVTPSEIRGYSSLIQDSMVMALPPDAIVENPLFFEQIVTDFAGKGTVQKTYRLVDLLDFEVRDTRYEKQGEELLEQDGRRFNTVVVDRLVEATGTRARMWIETQTAMLVKMMEQDGNVVSLAGPAVVARVQRVNMDKDIFNQTDVVIADVAAITYMKVRARIRPVGMRPTPETLNVPGQKFTGTVEDNLIDGVFEIEHPRYDGDAAPAFPVAETDPEMAAYIAADGIYESDDEVLAKKAGEITAGAANTWEAATRLAKWVSDEISYAIPGGGTARGTYDIRAAECGGHSILLATFCRAVGIPARMVWGCMYTPGKGGSFGQHGWTEVHMGEAGWIPLDTARETNFVDSGHIRVGHYASLVSRLNGQEFEVLDYRVAGASGESVSAAEQRYAPYLGKYRDRESSGLRNQDRGRRSGCGYPGCHDAGRG